MNNKEIDKQIKKNDDFIKKTSDFIKESEGVVGEYWIKCKSGDYLVEFDGNVIDITSELIKRVGYLEIVI